MIVGESSLGKSRLIRALTGVEQSGHLDGGLLHSVRLSDQTSVYQLNSLCNKSIEIVAVPEIGMMFSAKANPLVLSHFNTMCTNTAGLESSTHKSVNSKDIPAHLCVISATQGIPKLKKDVIAAGHDWMSFYNRFDLLYFKGGELPNIPWDRRWEIEKQAMGQFLFNILHTEIPRYKELR